MDDEGRLLNYVRVDLLCELPPEGWPMKLADWSHLNYADYPPWVACRLHATLCKSYCTQGDIDAWDAGLNPIHSRLDLRPNIDITRRGLSKFWRRTTKWKGRYSLHFLRPLICYEGGPMAGWCDWFKLACCEDEKLLIDFGSVHLSVDAAWSGRAPRPS